ncbi:phage tail protein [Proteus mirabilis]|uniref:phage tail protein n=1 Tax=Proteus mirabilis TaxID=584 RepID=UPI0038A6FC9D
MKNPKLISKPFAQNGQKNVIPEKYETSMESNQATWDQGFGQITMLPVSAGGLPPKGQDFNGILNQMCETIVHISKGGAFKFSADYATAINGYPKGAILQSEDEKKYYQSIIDNNKVNFNTASQDQIKTSWKLVMTDDLLDQLSKKLESSAVVQSTGTSTTSVMSQKASTEVFQPKGNYAVKGESYTKAESDTKFQPKGDYATTAALTSGLNGKFDKSGGTITGDVTFSKNAIKSTKGTHTLPNKSGTLMQVGDYGVGVSLTPSRENYTSTTISCGFYAMPGGASNPWGANGSAHILNVRDGKYGFQIGKTTGNKSLSFRTLDNGEFSPTSVLYSASNTTKDHNGFLKVSGSSSELSDYPVGSPIPWPQATAPSGFLVCNGQSFNKSTYHLLALAYPSGVLPDLRGEFIRGLDTGRGIDTGREVLSSQSGNSLLSARGMGGNSEFSLKMTSGSVGTDNQGQREIYQQIEGQNGNETRPRNIAFLYIVRAA